MLPDIQPTKEQTDFHLLQIHSVNDTNVHAASGTLHFYIHKKESEKTNNGIALF